MRDWGALHKRLVRGFAVDCRLDGADRIVTFFNGAVVRERPIDCDDDERRLAWSIVDGPYAHHNGSAQVFDAGDGRSRFVWITDLLPDDLRAGTEELMERGIRAARETLELPFRFDAPRGASASERRVVPAARPGPTLLHRRRSRGRRPADRPS
ncbi:MAG: SRPBCC family protein [Solirubrobacteraceae bacterium]